MEDRELGVTLIYSILRTIEFFVIHRNTETDFGRHGVLILSVICCMRSVYIYGENCYRALCQLH